MVSALHTDVQDTMMTLGTVTMSEPIRLGRSLSLMRVLFIAAILGVSQATTLSDLYGTDCSEEGYRQVLIQAFTGIFADGTFDADTAEDISESYSDVLAEVADATDVPVSAVSTVDDADTDSDYDLTSGHFGGFLMFTAGEDGMEAYWATDSHLAWALSLIGTLFQDDDGRGAASLQYQHCVPSDLQGLGTYHMGLVIDVAEDSDDAAEACRETLVATLYAIADAAEDTADVAGLCGRQWEDWETLENAEDIAWFGLNKANSADDVGCVYNFASEDARDTFLDSFKSLYKAEAGTTIGNDACVEDFWAWAME